MLMMKKVNRKDWIACIIITIIAVIYPDCFGILPIIASVCMVYIVSGFPDDNNECREGDKKTYFLIFVSTGIAYFIYFMIGSGQWNNGLVLQNEIIILPTYAILFVYVIPLIWLRKQKNLNIRKMFSFDKETRKISLLICIIYFYYSCAQISIYYIESSIISKWMPLHMMVQSFWVAAVAEELFFRGYIYNLLKKVCCTTYAQMVSSLIFTFSHFNLLIKLINEGVTVQIIINYISIFVLGWCSAFIYEKRKNLIPSIVLHTCVNDFFKYFIILGIQNLSS